MKKQFLRFILIILLNILISNILISDIYAFTWPWQKEKAKDIIDPQIYEVLEKRKLLDQFFEEESISWDQNLIDLSEEKRQKLIEKTNEIMALDLGPRPEFTVDEEGKTYTFITGINGNSSGKIPSGRYLIEAEELKKVNIFTTKHIDIKNTGKRRFYIGLKKGRGKVFYKKGGESKNAKIIKVSALGSLSNEDMVVQLFNDNNSNGIWDKKEDPVLWAGVKIKLTLISKEQEFSFDQGINEMEIEENPISSNTAFELLLDLEKAGAEPEWIKIKNGWPEDIFSFQGERFFGNDFSLEKGETYQFWLNKSVKLKIMTND